MTFEKTPRGSRGDVMSVLGRPMMKFMGGLMVRRLHRSGGSGRAMGVDVLVLTTVGAKTGQRRQTVVAWFPDGEDAWLVVASAGGTAANPAWYHNLAAHPDQVQIEIGGKTVDVTAAQLSGQERDAAWQRVVAAAPRFAGYQKKTDRTLPVIRLTPRG